MADAVLLAQATRGPFVESSHLGHAVIARADGSIVESWGNPDELVFARSSAKMIQALPLVESGAGAGLTAEQLALACASHAGERVHLSRVNRWLDDLGLDDHALCCGPQASSDPDFANHMIRQGTDLPRALNECSGKHAGFLTLNQHLGGGADYIDPDHPVQRAVREAFEDVKGRDSPGLGIDGCSAPNFATALRGVARAMAVYASADGKPDARSKAAVALRDAMITHPDMVAGTGHNCTLLMRAASEPVAVKYGAEGFFVAMLPRQNLGVALKVSDGAMRGAAAAIAALLVRLGALDPSHPVVGDFLERPVKNRDGLVTGVVRPAAGLAG